MNNKIKCDCGNYLLEKRIIINNKNVKAMVCNKCNFSTLTKIQAKKFLSLK